MSSPGENPVASIALVNQALQSLGLAGAPPAAVYADVDRIVAFLQQINAQQKVNVTVTGKISEILCEYGLRASTTQNGSAYARMPAYWKWVGDYYVLGDPFNLIVSVKSFTAKERLLASGSGNALSPTVGWGLFKDVREFSYDRLVSYAYRSFVAIYAPGTTCQRLSPQAAQFSNINGNPLMRPLSQFVQEMGVYLTPVTPICSVSGCGGLSARPEGVGGTLFDGGGLPRVPLSPSLA
jgi:hypothetical protein